MSVLRTVSATNNSTNLAGAVGAALYRQPQNILVTGYDFVGEYDGFSVVGDVYNLNSSTGVVGSTTSISC
jgi:hypothetical protein